MLFLDIYHVEVDGSHNIRKPLVDALDQLIGPDDLVAVMTPEMSARDITFARKTTTIEGILTRYWHWGERDRIASTDPRIEQYQSCYPERCRRRLRLRSDQNGIADEMIERRHEKLTLDALDRSGPLPPRRARRAQGDPRDQRRLAAVSAGRQRSRDR